MFAKFNGLSTVINFAKGNRSVCFDQNVGKKLDVAASDEAALFLSYSVPAVMSSQI